MLFDQISRDIIASMKAHDQVRTDALRMIKKNFIEAKTAPGSDGELSDAAALKIITKLVKQGKETAQMFRDNGREEKAAEAEAAAAIYEEYLPKQLSAAELEAEVRAVIAEAGATSMKDMGRVMGTATKRLAGRADGSAISALVKQLLA